MASVCRITIENYLYIALNYNKGVFYGSKFAKTQQKYTENQNSELNNKIKEKKRKLNPKQVL